MRNLQLSIVLPALKERDNLALFIPDIERQFKPIEHEIIVVDDDSQDGTKELVMALDKEYGNLELITRLGKRGIGSALRAGYTAACGKVIISSDCDLSFSPQDLQKLFDKINEGFDLAIGCRHVINGSYYEMKKPATTLKGLASKTGNIALKALSGIGINDFSANCRAIRSSAWKVINVRENTNVMLFEMIVKASHHGLKITQVPVTFRERAFGRSKLNLAAEIPKAVLKSIYYLARFPKT